MSKTTAVFENGHNVYASTGGVAQSGGKLKIMECNDCHHEVVWVKSQKTGRFYLVNVRKNHNGARYYAGNDVHKCQEEQERDDKLVAWMEAAMKGAQEMTIVYNDSTGAVVYQAVDNTTDAVELAATLGLDSWELLDDQDRTIRTVFPRMELV